MNRFSSKVPQREAVTVYSGTLWTGPGRSHWVETFWEPDAYAQMRVSERKVDVPSWFAELVRDAKSVEARARVVGQARRLGLL